MNIETKIKVKNIQYFKNIKPANRAFQNIVEIVTYATFRGDYNSVVKIFMRVVFCWKEIHM